ncbi:pentapeptide repeat-containing protein (plasmid) [Sinorhizobium meliloti]|uniref:pentapeptide repeat-containing protein n=2 Tax=Rhizobium meliloti TaxID=382 RepID=UPI000B4A1B8B|nr:pentapeptide repeat-containing protein [Sinorhizobium meliloti]ASP76481.1 pentapeptide repeat-containing protein [Sinorhizobium meliloti]
MHWVKFSKELQLARLTSYILSQAIANVAVNCILTARELSPLTLESIGPRKGELMLLEEAFFKTTFVEKVTFSDEDVSEFRAQGTKFRDCHFSGCDFRSAILRDSEFVACRFSNCDLREVEFRGCNFSDSERQKGSEWSYCNFGEAKFVSCNITMNKIVKSQAFMLNVSDCSAVGLNFDADVHRKISKQTMFGGVIFRRTKLQYSIFLPANYEESVFEGCDLRDCSFAGSNLSRANFRWSSINNVDFSRATLDNASLANATFDELDLAAIFSFKGMFVSRDQHENLLSSIGILTAD